MRVLLSIGVLAMLTTTAAAQDRKIAEEPTGGIELPVTPLAGEHDARATTVNPAGLTFLHGSSLALALSRMEDEDATTQSGGGFGLYVGGPLGGGVTPRVGLGLGLEWMRPSRVRLDPDPGTPLRTTVALALPLGSRAALGVGWHHFSDSGPLGGADTWDLGLSWRLGNRFAIGAVVRDVDGQVVAFEDQVVPVQRRYELELTSRPLGTDVLDLGLGGRIGERRADVDGWARASLKVVRGLFVHAAFETDALQIIETTPSGMREEYQDRDYRATLGLEVSFGGLGVAAYGTGAADEEGDLHGAGTVVARISAEEIPAIQGRADRIERIDLSEVGVRDVTKIVLRMRAIAKDSAVRGVVIALDGLGAGWASVQELREEVLAMRAAGKKVFAYMVNGTSRDYYLASAADKIYLDPAGGIRLTGIAGTSLYFRGALDKIGVLPEFNKIAEYKSAPEQFTDVGPSEPAAFMYGELFDGIYAELVDAIAEGRGLDREAVIQLIEDGPYHAGQLAKDKRLVDGVGVPDEVAERIEVELGGLWPVREAPTERDDRWERPTVAVIYADGEIVDGKSQSIPLLGRKLVGGENIISSLVWARTTPSVKAVVIRIDSPGGSALASELMSREVFKLRGVKPIICSMGDVAASGGYYLAAGCDVIFAEPTTITGSIGIFSGKVDVSGLLGKLGVTTNTRKRGDHADMDGFYRAYTEEERAIVQEQITYQYGRFTEAVSKGRSMPVAKVDDVGRGHVWTGKQALEKGLVDRMGGLGDALAYAKEQAGLDPDEKVRLVELPRPEGGLLNALLGGVTKARDEERLDLFELGALRDVLGALPASVLVNPDQPQARLPFELTWD